MNIFVILLIILIISSPFSRKPLNKFNDTTNENRKTYVIVISVVLIAISGLRDITVGIDTLNYYNEFNIIKNMQFEEIFQYYDKDYGYRIFQFVFTRYSDSFQLFLIVVAIINITSFSVIVYKYSKNPSLSYLLFVGFGFYSFGLSAIRQSLAIAISLQAFSYIINKKPIKFLAAVGLASTFHFTALIFMPIYLSNFFKINKKSLFLVLFVLISAIFFKDNIRNYIIQFSSADYSAIETGGYKFYFMLVFSLAIGFFYKNSLQRVSTINRSLFFMMAAAIVIMPITQFHPAVMRLYYYYSIFITIYIPNVFYVIKDRFIKMIGIWGYSLTAIFLFVTNIIPVNRLNVFKFFWQ